METPTEEVSTSPSSPPAPSTTEVEKTGKDDDKNEKMIENEETTTNGTKKEDKTEENQSEENGSEGRDWKDRISDATDLAQRKIQEIRPLIDKGTDTLKKNYTAARESETVKNLERRISNAGERAAEGIKYANDTYRSVKNSSLEKYEAVKNSSLEKYEAVKNSSLEKYEAVKSTTVETVVRATEKLNEKTKNIRKKAATAAIAASERVEELRRRAKEKYPQYFGNAKKTKAAEAFREALNRGFEGVEIKAGQCFQLPFRVADEETRELQWEFHLWDLDLEFKVLHRTMAVGGAVEVHVRNPSKCTSGERVKGFYKPHEAGTIILAWDNTSSWMRSKHVAYRARFVDDDVGADAEEEGGEEGVDNQKKAVAASVATAPTMTTSAAPSRVADAGGGAENHLADAHSDAHLRKLSLVEAASPTQMRKSLVEDDDIKPIALPRNLPPPGSVTKTLKLPPAIDLSADMAKASVGEKESAASLEATAAPIPSGPKALGENGK